jgi:PAS domain-containing protein
MPVPVGPRRGDKGSEGRYRGLLEAAPDATVVVNGASDIVLLKYQRNELVGRQFAGIIPEGFAVRMIADDLRSATDAPAQQPSSPIRVAT